jgi:oligo-1,6-glucosidase
MVKLRKDNLVLVYGKYTLLDRDNPQVYAYIRELNGKELLVLLNFSAQGASVNTRTNLNNAKILISNYTSINTSNLLRPYEAVVYELK